jgi:cephalosporin-C deacetylase-like acetyl esterase
MNTPQTTAAVIFALIGIFVFSPRCAADRALQKVLGKLNTTVLSEDEQTGASAMVARDIERRRLLAIQRENKAWSNVNTRDDWERFRDQRLSALRKSLGQVPPATKHLNVRTTGRIEGDGYRIENVVFESRPGLFVTANLYLPAKPTKSMPAVLFSHSHHNSKTQGELQDMGMTWARQGWVVLVMDLLGHGERRQHPFVSSDQYPKSFRVGRQDYYFRYNVGMQLQLVGESLLGWMVGDLMRGVDLLCSREGVDKKRITLIGSVAGGGDPAGLAAALDPRIAAVAPFNFGGPQPDYAIPKDAENKFYYFGVAFWETTRCLRLGGRDGFAHWAIVGSVAPRRLIYSHEFGWDRVRDPAWPRLEKVFRFYGARDHLDVATGRGNLKGRPPENTHCNNVGVFHRRKLYPHLQRWFDMKPPVEEFQQRRETKELMCLTASVSKTIDPQPVYKLVGKLAAQRASSARRRLQSLDLADRTRQLREDWSQLLGEITPAENPKIVRSTNNTAGDVAIKRVLLEVEDGIIVPLALIRAASNKQRNSPMVVVIARAGKQRVLAARSREIADLIEGGAVVCLPDLRGTGETRSGSSVGPRSSGTTLSCRDQVLGQTLLGSRLRDLRSVLRYLRARKNSSAPIALWGDSLAAINPKDRSEVVPYGVGNPNVQAEPSGGLLALLCALFEDDIQAIYASGTFASFRSLLGSHFLYVPHDVVVPGALAVSDVPDIAATLAPRPLRMDNFVNGLNRQCSADDLRTTFAPTIEAYRDTKASNQLSLSAGRSGGAAAWLLSQIKK